MAEEELIEQLHEALNECDSVIVGAGAGLSTAAGIDLSGPRFDKYFDDISCAYGITDMYSGGFYPYPTPEAYWGFWCRNIWVNRYMLIPKNTYNMLLQLVGDKDHFVITTNVDHCFQKSGFDKKSLFYMQGDFGLFQCARPCCQKTWNNYDAVREMVESQGFVVGNDGTLLLPGRVTPAITIPSDLIPVCPECGGSVIVNLRTDNTFVEDAGWHEANDRYQEYLDARFDSGKRLLYFELGVGFNTPVIIKYPFWQMTATDPHATYCCVNMGDVGVPEKIVDRSICIDDDINEVLTELVK